MNEQIVVGIRTGLCIFWSFICLFSSIVCAAMFRDGITFLPWMILITLIIIIHTVLLCCSWCEKNQK